MNIWHKGSINSHPGQDETIRHINKEYFWPGARGWIAEYIKGCATCQQNKNMTHCIKTPMFRIPSTISAKPFSHIAMDLITGLPKSEGHDAILLRSAVTMPTKNFFPSSLTPTRSSPYPFLYAADKTPSDWHVVKLRIPELSPFTRFDLHVVKLQPRPDFT
jgi:hypothetical protein